MFVNMFSTSLRTGINIATSVIFLILVVIAIGRLVTSRANNGIVNDVQYKLASTFAHLDGHTISQLAITHQTASSAQCWYVYNARTDDLSLSCNCKAGEVASWDTGSCVSEQEANDHLCQDDFGAGSGWTGQPVSDGQPWCNCMNGYSWDAAGDACVMQT